MASDVLSWLAASLVLVSVMSTSFHTYRVIALCSNVLFIGYGLTGGELAILALHLALLAINLVRLVQMGWPMRGSIVLQPLVAERSPH